MDAHLGLYLNSQAKGSWGQNNLCKARKAILLWPAETAAKVPHSLKPSLMVKTQFT